MLIKFLFSVVLFFFFSGMLLLSNFLVYPSSETMNFCLFVSILCLSLSSAFLYTFKK